MPLVSGEKLGPYEILSPLGAGGMGEVYRARDTRLGRTVAIKILPEHLSQKSDLRQRLESEARTISKLSHPNICTLHDIGHQDGKDYLVLEFVEGTTLRQLLTAGNLPLRKLIPIAVQVADGLAKAHETGIVHRDLKPENLMVSTETVKILDFGLAKFALEDEERLPDNLASSATTTFQTQQGTILGTIAYMSPEQARGDSLDFRSDQFSFGLVLYEMATGKRPFIRPTQVQTLAAIIEDEAESVSTLNPEMPPPFCWVIERCLAKEPEKRYFSTRDLARDLLAIRDRLSDLQLKRPGARPSNLPVPGTAFVGRDREVAAANALLQRPDVRLLTITGPGGIGKSRLALEVARHMADDFPAGVYFVPLAAVSDANLITLVIAQTLGIRETGGQSPLDALREYLKGSLGAPMLFLIDNFEHLVGAAPILAGLLTTAPNLKFLVTSRAALHVYHEHEFPVPPLSLPDAKSPPALGVLSEYSAISLFIQRAVAVKPDFKLTDENASAITEICSRLDGLPLAIELAAARTKLLSPSAMRTRLASSLQLLTGGARDLPARQQTLRQAIDWSYDLLSEPEQKLFRRISVFAGGCTLEAVESVSDTKQDLQMDVLDGMASMVDKSLARQIEHADGEPRFVLLETIREYGLEKLKESGEEAETRRAHAAYCLVLAEEGAAEDISTSPAGWPERFQLEHDNFRTALEWLTKTKNVDWGLRLAVGLFRFWEMREHFAEGRDRLAKLLLLDAPAAPNLRQRALFASGVLANAQGDYVASDALFNESLDIGNKSEDKRSVAISFNALAVNARERGDLPSSGALFEASLGLWRDLQESLAIARALSNLASIAKLQDDYPKARALYEECLAIFEEVGDRTGVAWALNHQGDAARQQGDLVAARSLCEQSLATFRELGDRWGIAGSLADLGNLAREQKDYSTADSLFRESLRIFQELEHKRGIARILESFACSAAVQSQAERALRLAGAAAALRQSIGAPLTAAEQAKLERGLDPARQKLTIVLGRTAWLEGWVMPVDKAIEDVLKTAASGVN